MSSKNKKIPHYKIIILGDKAVGKSSFLIRFTENKFHEIYLSTTGMDYKYKDVTYEEGKTIRLQIWDTAGQERYRTVTPALFKGAIGIILMYAITDRESFEHVENWITSIETEAQKKVILILVGNKVDKKDRKVFKEEGEQVAKEKNFPFFETSAQTGYNVNSVFETLAKLIVEKKAHSENQGQKLTSTKNKEKKKCC